MGTHQLPESNTRRISVLIPTVMVWALAAASVKAQDLPVLESRRPVAAKLLCEDITQSYRFVIPANARYVEIRLVCGVADLDIDVYAEDSDEGMYTSETAMYTSETDAGHELIEIDHTSDPALVAGDYRVEVSYNLVAAPRWQGTVLTEIPYSLVAVVITDRIDAVLEPGMPISATLEDDSGRFRTYAIDVPDDTSAMRIDVTDTPGDVDIFLRRSREQLDPALAPYIADLMWGCESLVVAAADVPAGLAGKWFLDVAEWHGRGSEPVPFRVHLTYSAEAPAELAAVPAPIARDAGDLVPNCVVPAVVELFSAAGGGTGTVVRRDGVILTCAHVVADFGGQSPAADVVVAVYREISLPPVESFRARVVEFDAARDIALLQIDRGFYGQPLPADYEFPAVPLATAAPALGVPLWVLGFPASGGTGTRASISCSRGVVVGFERRASATFVKTDAAIHAGHSGGAAIDGEGRLVAIPSETQSDDIGELGYLFPVYQLPLAWRENWLAVRAEGGR